MKLFLCAVLFFCCAFRAQADDRVRITYASRSISSILPFIAVDKGYFKEEALEPQLILTRGTTAMDPIDPFYQQLDSETLLARHGPKLADDARNALRKSPNLRLAGVNAQADSPEAEPLRRALAARVGQPVPAGLLVGYGTRLGSGCTSGHGICGLARLSKRSLAATLLFMASAIVTVFVIRHLIGV